MVMLRCAPLLLLFTSLQAGAQSAADCATRVDLDERLACYDEIFRQSGQPPGQSSRTEDLGLPSTQPPTPTAPEPGAKQGEDDFGVEQAERVKRTRPKQLAEIQSTVKVLRRRDRQEMIFLLENGQMWIQDVFRFMTINEGDAVTIRHGRMGGYIMTTEKGASTRVQRIK